MQIYDLGIDYLDRRNALMEAVTLDDVNRIAKALLDPAALTMIVVGEPEGVRTASAPPSRGIFTAGVSWCGPHPRGLVLSGSQAASAIQMGNQGT